MEIDIDKSTLRHVKEISVTGMTAILHPRKDYTLARLLAKSGVLSGPIIPYLACTRVDKKNPRLRDD